MRTEGLPQPLPEGLVLQLLLVSREATVEAAQGVEALTPGQEFGQAHTLPSFANPVHSCVETVKVRLVH